MLRGWIQALASGVTAVLGGRASESDSGDPQNFEHVGEPVEAGSCDSAEVSLAEEASDLDRHNTSGTCVDPKRRRVENSGASSVWESVEHVGADQNSSATWENIESPANSSQSGVSGSSPTGSDGEQSVMNNSAFEEIQIPVKDTKNHAPEDADSSGSIEIISTETIPVASPRNGQASPCDSDTVVISDSMIDESPNAKQTEFEAPSTELSKVQDEADEGTDAEFADALENLNLNAQDNVEKRTEQHTKADEEPVGDKGKKDRAEAKGGGNDSNKPIRQEEGEHYLSFVHRKSEAGQLIFAKKLIYQLGYLTDISANDLQDAVVAQYKIATERKCKDWIKDCRYYGDLLFTKKWLDENIPPLGRKGKQQDWKQKKSRNMARGEWSYQRGEMCRDVRLDKDPTLPVYRANAAGEGAELKVQGGDGKEKRSEETDGKDDVKETGAQDLKTESENKESQQCASEDLKNQDAKYDDLERRYGVQEVNYGKQMKDKSKGSTDAKGEPSDIEKHDNDQERCLSKDDTTGSCAKVEDEKKDEKEEEKLRQQEEAEKERIEKEKAEEIRKQDKAMWDEATDGWIQATRKRRQSRGKRESESDVGNKPDLPEESAGMENHVTPVTGKEIKEDSEHGKHEPPSSSAKKSPKQDVTTRKSPDNNDKKPKTFTSRTITSPESPPSFAAAVTGETIPPPGEIKCMRELIGHHKSNAEDKELVQVAEEIANIILDRAVSSMSEVEVDNVTSDGSLQQSEEMAQYADSVTVSNVAELEELQCKIGASEAVSEHSVTVESKITKVESKECRTESTEGIARVTATEEDLENVTEVEVGQLTSRMTRKESEDSKADSQSDGLLRGKHFEELRLKDEQSEAQHTVLSFEDSAILSGGVITSVSVDGSSVQIQEAPRSGSPEEYISLLQQVLPNVPSLCEMKPDHAPGFTHQPSPKTEAEETREERVNLADLSVAENVEIGKDEAVDTSDISDVHVKLVVDGDEDNDGEEENCNAELSTQNQGTILASEMHNYGKSKTFRKLSEDKGSVKKHTESRYSTPKHAGVQRMKETSHHPSSGRKILQTQAHGSPVPIKTMKGFTEKIKVQKKSTSEEVGTPRTSVPERHRNLSGSKKRRESDKAREHTHDGHGKGRHPGSDRDSVERKSKEMEKGKDAKGTSKIHPHEHGKMTSSVKEKERKGSSKSTSEESLTPHLKSTVSSRMKVKDRTDKPVTTTSKTDMGEKAKAATDVNVTKDKRSGSEDSKVSNPHSEAEQKLNENLCHGSSLSEETEKSALNGKSENTILCAEQATDTMARKDVGKKSVKECYVKLEKLNIESNQQSAGAHLKSNSYSLEGEQDSKEQSLSESPAAVDEQMNRSTEIILNVSDLTTATTLASQTEEIDLSHGAIWKFSPGRGSGRKKSMSESDLDNLFQRIRSKTDINVRRHSLTAAFNRSLKDLKQSVNLGRRSEVVGLQKRRGSSLYTLEQDIDTLPYEVKTAKDLTVRHNESESEKGTKSSFEQGDVGEDKEQKCMMDVNFNKIQQETKVVMDDQGTAEVPGDTESIVTKGKSKENIHVKPKPDVKSGFHSKSKTSSSSASGKAKVTNVKASKKHQWRQNKK